MKTRRALTLVGLLLAVAIAAVATAAEAADWTQFRGPGGLATSQETGLPSTWSLEENLLWRTELRGPGGSSPITVGDRIYLTAYSGYGLEPNEGSDDDLMRHVICLDRKSGKTVWTKEFKPRLPESVYKAGNDSHHGFATSTPVSDGERLYVFFGKSGVYCLDLEGNEIWHELVGDGTKGWGSGASPVLFGDLLIVNASVESGALVALDKRTGKQVWTAEERLRGAWNTPLLVKTDAGKTELVISLPQKLVGIDPESGKTLWYCDGIRDGSYVCPSAVAHEGIVYAIGGRTNTALAVRAGGSGDVTDTHVLWFVGAGSNVSSPVYHDGHVFWVHEGGIAYCLDAKTGEEVYAERLAPRTGRVYSSVTLADGKLYAVSQYAGTYVIAANPTFELLAHNTIADDESRANASPVVDSGRLLLRNDRYLYCIGTK
jgi:hypothetical protein